MSGLFLFISPTKRKTKGKPRAKRQVLGMGMGKFDKWAS
jgi:hypothetical protein